MLSVRIWHDWLIAGAQKPHADTMRQAASLKYTPW